MKQRLVINNHKQGHNYWGGQAGHGPLNSISETNRIQHFQSQTSGILLLTGVQNLCRLKISRFLPCMLQFLDNFESLNIRL